MYMIKKKNEFISDEKKFVNCCKSSRNCKKKCS